MSFAAALALRASLACSSRGSRRGAHGAIWYFASAAHAAPPAQAAAQPMVDAAEVAGAWQMIDSLEGNGISAGDLKKLKERGLHTVEAVAYATRKELVDIKGISDQKVEKLLTAAQKMVNMGFSTATEIHHARQDICQLTTGCKDLDELLHVGLDHAVPVQRDSVRANAVRGEVRGEGR